MPRTAKGDINPSGHPKDDLSHTPSRDVQCDGARPTSSGLGSGYQAQHDDGHRHGGHFRAMPGFHDYGQKGWTFA
jgi:hypothetical protein